MRESDQDWYDAMKRQGHVPIMYGDEIDMWVMDYEYHNGPGCQVCHWSCCQHCDSPAGVPKCGAISKREYQFNIWIFRRNLDVAGYQNFTKQDKLRIINEIRKLYGKPVLCI